MASIYRRKSDQARGKRGRWTISYLDEYGRKRSRVAYTDKAASMELARHLETEARRIRDGLASPADKTLQESRRKSLAEHLADYQADLTARGQTARHVREYASAARRLFADARATNLSSIAPDRLQAALGRLRGHRSARTANHALSAAKAFVRWLVMSGRLASNPIQHLRPYPQAAGRVRVRRALTVEEASRLIEATPEFDRRMLYRVALATGYRANELRNLTPESFRLIGEVPSVVLGAEHTKDGKAADQPIGLRLRFMIVAWLEEKTPGRPVFRFTQKSAKMLRRDLKRAGIPAETPEGRIDFHSLRVTYVTLLIRAGVDVKTVQELARHSTPSITLAFYARSSEAQKAEAIGKLPEF